MKKIYSLIAIMLICSAMVFAQDKQAVQTTIDGILAEMPAQKGDSYNQLMKQLAATGEEGVIQLVKRLHPPGQGSNAAVEYVLSGLSHYITGLKVDMPRMTVATGYTKALDQVSDREIKAFVIRQLEITGREESVAKLTSYLSDESLGGPASRALAAINTPESGEALLNALDKTTNEKLKKDIVMAIGEIQLQSAEPSLKTLLGSSDENLQKAVLYALGRVGTKSSLTDLALMADKAGYAMEKTGATEAYIALIKRVLAQKDVKEAEKAAADLMKNAEKAGQIQTRIAAFEIQVAAKPMDITKLITTAMKDNDRKYRVAALSIASANPKLGTYIELAKLIQDSKSDDVRIDVMNQFMVDMKDAKKKRFIDDVRLVAKNDGAKSLIQVLGTVLIDEKEKKKTSMPVKQTAIRLLSAMDDNLAGQVLVNLFTESDKQIVEPAKEGLSAFALDMSYEIEQIMPEASDIGKVAGLQLIAQRKSTYQEKLVMEQLKSTSPEVKAAAYQALKDVVTIENMSKLYPLLEEGDEATIVPVQQAITELLSNYTPDRQAALIIKQMETAGAAKEHLYYPILAATGDAKALEIISDKFDSKAGTDKDIAFSSLLSFEGQEATTKLYAIAKDASGSAYFDRALNRYIELSASPKLDAGLRAESFAKALDIAKTDKQKNQILKHLGNVKNLQALLLAGKYLDDKALQQNAANSVMDIALANKDLTGNEVKALLNKVVDLLDNPDAAYQRAALRKHLGEMPKE
ncbi:HEAT repeat domain-containing protein [Dysgonomonas sp. 511]|uniref:HEAT repeat domain-containing protein n=1 Tax=Dysgonomonas sp. 511 TaxID=2302930 RepID=UPI0013D72910|nr:HEAT repeat domain-containing protein [Dysgonomonas sp. 511]NDV78833.1 HEAT repeat domain-containing protein [Dysgonomonas sp. 511]